MTRPIHIGNAQGFWGDSPDAALRLATQAPDLDVVTLDYLAEVSMSILAKQRSRDPSLGYAKDFLDVVRSLVPIWQSGRKLRVIANAGGLNPRGCGEAIRSIAPRGMKIGVVSGDDVLPLIDTDEPLVTANAYLGAAPLVEAIRHGADIIVTGRVADPSLTVAPAVAHFGWAMDDYARIAGATVAGHLIECGTQVTGGISTDWLQVPSPAEIGFPIVEIAHDGSCVVTKPRGTGGRVDQWTVKEQLVYEIGDPANYLSPDAAVSFLGLRVDDLGNDRVHVRGAIGSAPPPTYKVSATCHDGFRATGMLTIFGRNAVTKARRAGEMILQRLREAGHAPEKSNTEAIGGGDVVPGVLKSSREPMEVVLRISVADSRREVVERFAKEIAPLVTAGPQGTTGYAEGRPAVREAFGYRPMTIARKKVRATVEILEA